MFPFDDFIMKIMKNSKFDIPKQTEVIIIILPKQNKAQQMSGYIIWDIVGCFYDIYNIAHDVQYSTTMI